MSCSGGCGLPSSDILKATWWYVPVHTFVGHCAERSTGSSSGMTCDMYIAPACSCSLALVHWVLRGAIANRTKYCQWKYVPGTSIGFCLYRRSLVPRNRDSSMPARQYEIVHSLGILQVFLTSFLRVPWFGKQMISFWLYRFQFMNNNNPKRRLIGLISPFTEATNACHNSDVCFIFLFLFFFAFVSFQFISYFCFISIRLLFFVRMHVLPVGLGY